MTEEYRHVHGKFMNSTRQRDPGRGRLLAAQSTARHHGEDNRKRQLETGRIGSGTEQCEPVVAGPQGKGGGGMKGMARMGARRVDKRGNGDVNTNTSPSQKDKRFQVPVPITKPNEARTCCFLA